jgi:hypothetical protein
MAPHPHDGWRDLADSVERYSTWQERLTDCSRVHERRGDILANVCIESERKVVAVWLASVRELAPRGGPPTHS